MEEGEDTQSLINAKKRETECTPEKFVSYL